MKSLTAGAIKDSPIQIKTSTIKDNKTVELQQMPKKISRGVSTDKTKAYGNDGQSRPAQASQFNKENISRPCSRVSKSSTETKTFTVDDESSQKGDERVKMCKVPYHFL